MIVLVLHQFLFNRVEAWVYPQCSVGLSEAGVLRLIDPHLSPDPP